MSKTVGLYLDGDLCDEISVYQKRANCKSRNEFINLAIRHFIAFLQKDSDCEFLTPALESVLSAHFENTENRLARLLFKIAVELSMNLHVTASMSDVSDDEIGRLRAYCVEEVTRLNGRIGFDEANRHQNG